MSDFIESLRRSARPTLAERAFLAIHDAQVEEIARLKAENDALRAALHEAVLQVIREALPRKEGEE